MLVPQMKSVRYRTQITIVSFSSFRSFCFLVFLSALIGQAKAQDAKVVAAAGNFLAAVNVSPMDLRGKGGRSDASISAMYSDGPLPLYPGNAWISLGNIATSDEMCGILNHELFKLLPETGYISWDVGEFAQKKAPSWIRARYAGNMRRFPENGNLGVHEASRRIIEERLTPCLKKIGAANPLMYQIVIDRYVSLPVKFAFYGDEKTSFTTLLSIREGHQTLTFLLDSAAARAHKMIESKAAARGREEEASTKREQAYQEAIKNLPKRDPNDIVAQVLNYSSFGNDNGSEEVFANPFSNDAKKIPVYWYRDAAQRCTYRKAASKNQMTIGVGNMLGSKNEESVINLDELNPRLIKWEYQNSALGPMTVLLYDTERLVSSLGKLDLDRLERGWSLIYSKYCSGRRKAF